MKLFSSNRFWSLIFQQFLVFCTLRKKATLREYGRAASSLLLEQLRYGLPWGNDDTDTIQTHFIHSWYIKRESEIKRKIVMVSSGISLAVSIAQIAIASVVLKYINEDLGVQELRKLGMPILKERE
jgi:hypothetical protein